ncbi:cytochrome c3 family protein [Tropicimonas isoalkanivorans]|uniref:Uncharacterized protein n=1 Tax=Tropicimonas isoalkanivorans TaxID=441112 RepID=A0A1I1R9C7_9RHOB|nr:cytochrome c3 family protein [Tropicimonas isoalkanivorans]SFD26940.1 hypothetical protein SAMN04488094_1259 [Tropicimonas isoalkanivorans]
MIRRPALPSLITLAMAAILATSASTGAGLAQSAGSGPAIGDPENGQPIFIMPRSGPFAPQTIAVPNARVIAAWARSGHSDYTAEAFRHWDEDGAIDPECSVCHSGIGFRAFHGLDGGEKGIPKEPVPIGGVVDCETCHSADLGSITEVTLPSGIVHPVTGVEVACMTCHQGRLAGSDVATKTAEMADDEVNTELRFMNPHYYLAGSMTLGGYGGVGFQYPGKTYSGRFLHAKPVATCNSCHDPHSLDLSEATCLTCHFDGTPEDIRIARVSYDGSGDTNKGIHDDLAANSDQLMTMILAYAAQVAATPMVYDGDRYPYFFADANGDGVADEAEGRRVNYGAWTPRLLKAAFNWKAVTADPGAYAHNPPYALELIYDSIEDLAGPLDVDMEALGLFR